MIEGVIEISELRVRDIMIPRSQIIFIENDQDLEACLDVIIASAHSRFPVISDERDNIAGILHAKDLLKFFGLMRSNSNYKVYYDLLLLYRKVSVWIEC